MIVRETLGDGRTHTYSDGGFYIRQLDTGVLYEDAVDSVAHDYEETDERIPASEEPAEAEDYESALARLGVMV